MRIIGRTSVLLAMTAFVISAMAPAEVAHAATDSKFIAGVQIRPNSVTNNDLAQIAQMGFNGIRLGIRKELVTKDGRALDWSLYDRIFKLARQHNLTVVATLFDGDAAKHEGNRSPAWVNEFSSFAADTVKRYGYTNQVIWEIWNEPNGATYWSKTPDPVAYANMVRNTCQNMRVANPQATIFAGALGTDAAEFPYDPFIQQLTPIVKAGCINAISIHPYRQDKPETVSLTLADLRHRYPGVPFEITEWGYTAAGRAYSSSQAYAWTSRILLASQFAGSRIAIIYEWRSSKPLPSNREQNFGIIRTDGQPTMSFEPLARTLKWLRGSSERCLLNSKVYCLTSSTIDRQPVSLVWSDTCQSVTIAREGYDPRQSMDANTKQLIPASKKILIDRFPREFEGLPQSPLNCP